MEEFLSHLPNYAITKKNYKFPDWKIQYIKRNREFYSRHKEWLDVWIPKVLNFQNSHQKLEWNCGPEESHNIFDKIVQYRPSGIRIKKPTYSPTLVLTSTQIPIFPWVNLPSESLNEEEKGKGNKGRYMTKEEAAKLQGMQNLKKYPNTTTSAFKAFGNAVNVDVVMKITENLINYESNRERIHCTATECI